MQRILLLRDTRVNWRITIKIIPDLGLRLSVMTASVPGVSRHIIKGLSSGQTGRLSWMQRISLHEDMFVNQQHPISRHPHLRLRLSVMMAIVLSVPGVVGSCALEFELKYL